MKAFEVTIKDWRDFVIIVAAKSRGAAKAYECREADDAGWEIAFTRFRVKRAPMFDDQIKKPASRPHTLGWKDQGEAWGCLDTAVQPTTKQDMT